jgi:AraC family transcriptional regulator, transcriptional activator FtrA
LITMPTLTHPTRIHRRVGVLVCEEASLGSYGLALDVFRMANQLPGAWRFDLCRISPDAGPVPHEDGVLRVDAGLEALPTLDVLVIPSMWTQGARAVARHPQVAQVLSDLSPSVQLVSMCTGGYFLAAAGRLAGRRVTTHWALAEAMQADFPQLQIDPEPNLVAGDGVMCSGGSLAGIDACLMAVQALSDRRTAREVARMLVVDMQRGPQTAFMPAQGWRRHADTEVKALQAWMSANLAQAHTLESLAEQVHMSVRTLQRRFVAATGMTPMQHLQGLRIDRARELLESGSLPVPEVAAQVGYQDRVAFGRQFKKAVGVTPGAYRQQHPQRLTPPRRPPSRG